jgi:hypothetical protein
MERKRPKSTKYKRKRKVINKERKKERKKEKRPRHSSSG